MAGGRVGYWEGWKVDGSTPAKPEPGRARKLKRARSSGRGPPPPAGETPGKFGIIPVRVGST